LTGERDRIDEALGTLEGVTAQIGAYHAFSRTAYTIVDPLSRTSGQVQTHVPGV
jgi:hypothetical protein